MGLEAGQATVATDEHQFAGKAKAALTRFWVDLPLAAKNGKVVLCR